MDKDVALPIELEFWQSTFEYAIIEHFRDEIHINFQLWDEEQREMKKKFGSLVFANVWAYRFNRHKKSRYYHPEIKNDFRSSYQYIPNSSWLDSIILEREGFDKNWRKYDSRDYKHYIFQNNSFYVEIICSKVEFKLINENINKYVFWK